MRIKPRSSRRSIAFSPPNASGLLPRSSRGFQGSRSASFSEAAGAADFAEAVLPPLAALLILAQRALAAAAILARASGDIFRRFFPPLALLPAAAPLEAEEAADARPPRLWLEAALVPALAVRFIDEPPRREWSSVCKPSI